MLVVGCDIGTAVTKAALLENGRLKYYGRVPTDADPKSAVEKAVRDICLSLGLETTDVDQVLVTGWGADKVTSEYRKVNFANCVARGALWNVPGCRTVLHLGAQQSMVLSVNDKGNVAGFAVNDKCAAGCGKFLEIISGALEVALDDIPNIIGLADKQLSMTSQCAVFCESEVISRVNDGESVANILAAVVHALARSIASLARRVSIRRECVVSGGPSNNRVLVEYLSGLLKTEVKVFEPAPDIIAAIGAALHARG